MLKYIKIALKYILKQIETRFPEQFVVTVQDYTELRQEVAALNQYCQSILVLESKIKALTADLELVKANLGYIGSKKAFNPLER